MIRATADAQPAAEPTPAADAVVVKERPALRDAERTRAKILAAAEIEFADKGLAGARVDTIAEESGANKRMIYYYYGGKEELYVAMLERAYRHMRESERSLALSHLEPLEAIRALVEFKFDYFVDHPLMIKLLAGENMLGAEYLRRSQGLPEMHAALVGTIQGILDRGVAAGVIRPGLDPVQLYISISALSYFYFANSATLSTAFGRDLAHPSARAERRAHAVDVILAYLRPPARA